MKGRFIKVKCQKCANEQVIFGKASIPVKCTVCGATLSEPGGGKAKIKGKIIEVMS